MPKGNSYYVYVISDPRRKGPFKYGKWTAQYLPIYVGMGHGKRYINTVKPQQSNPYKNNKLAKIRAAGLEPIVRFVRIDLTRQAAFDLEMKLIALIGRCDSYGPLTNLTAGGDGVYDPSMRTRKLMSRKAKARGAPAHLPKLHRANRGRTHTEEACANMSAGCLRRGSYGPLSEEHKAAVSVSLKGRKKPPRTAEHNRRASEAQIKRFVVYLGASKSLKEWCSELNLKYDFTLQRLSRGWTPEEAFSIPPGGRRSG